MHSAKDDNKGLSELRKTEDGCVFGHQINNCLSNMPSSLMAAWQIRAMPHHKTAETCAS